MTDLSNNNIIGINNSLTVLSNRGEERMTEEDDLTSADIQIINTGKIIENDYDEKLSGSSGDEGDFMKVESDSESMTSSSNSDITIPH